MVNNLFDLHLWLSMRNTAAMYYKGQMHTKPDFRSVLISNQITKTKEWNAGEVSYSLFGTIINQKYGLVFKRLTI